ncbi:MAG: SEC-C metal-binding domain-containing protein [Ktedonobacterales bacterium]
MANGASAARLPQPAAAGGSKAGASGVTGLPSRNQPCPCGSGRKYKQCHGR